MTPSTGGSAGRRIIASCRDPLTMDYHPHILAPPTTPPRRPPKRSNQLVGVHFESPKRHRSWRRDAEPVIRPGLARQEQELTARLTSLLEKINRPSRDDNHVSDPGDTLFHDTEPTERFSPTSADNDCTDAQPSHSEHDPHPQRLLPDEAAQNLYRKWTLLVRELEEEYLGYTRQAIGRLGRSPEADTYGGCFSELCTTKSTPIQCLHFDCVYFLCLYRLG